MVAAAEPPAIEIAPPFDDLPADPERLTVLTEIPVGARTKSAGRLTASMRPAVWSENNSANVADADRPVRDLVLEALAAGPLNSMSLANVVDRKEMIVSSALTQLEHEGLIESRPVDGGPRRIEWMLKVQAQAA